MQLQQVEFVTNAGSVFIGHFSPESVGDYASGTNHTLPTNGYAKVWLNKQLVSHATVEGGHGKLEQAHFGLYASAALDSGVIYNDKLRIVEVSNEQEATNLLNDTW